MGRRACEDLRFPFEISDQILFPTGIIIPSTRVSNPNWFYYPEEAVSDGDCHSRFRISNINTRSDLFSDGDLHLYGLLLQPMPVFYETLGRGWGGIILLFHRNPLAKRPVATELLDMQLVNNHIRWLASWLPDTKGLKHLLRAHHQKIPFLREALDLVETSECYRSPL